jgi:hypothetical protein
MKAGDDSIRAALYVGSRRPTGIMVDFTGISFRYAGPV